MKRLALISALVLSLALGTALAADQMPSSKVAVALGSINRVEATSNSAGPVDSGWQNILRTYIKTPNGKELLFGVSLECGIYTKTKVSSKGGTADTSSATGSVKVRVKVTGPDGVVRYAAPSGNVQNNATSPTGAQEGVVFSRRTQTMTAEFMGIFDGTCFTINPDDTITIDPECFTPETLDLLLDTLEANSFNFLLANVSPGVQKIEVQAKLEASSTAQTGTSSAKAAIGLGSLVVETVRLVQGDDGTPELQ